MCENEMVQVAGQVLYGQQMQPVNQPALCSSPHPPFSPLLRFCNLSAATLDYTTFLIDRLPSCLFCPILMGARICLSICVSVSVCGGRQSPSLPAVLN
mmetsp:Transcript_49353/g.97247  ORF Transcript_49353/g.97247 Transcript_49353/m.97247 type:complete len:98 (+) Transcript_49353:557-850(+)